MVCGRERLQIARIAIQGGSGTKRLGDSEPTHGIRKEGASQGALHQPRREERPDVLCQEEMDPFWGKGHLPNLRAQTSGRVCIV